MCTLIIMVMKAMYSRTLMKPGRRGQRVTGPRDWAGQAGDAEHRLGRARLLTCRQLGVEHVHSLVVPGIFALEVHRGVAHT